MAIEVTTTSCSGLVEGVTVWGWYHTCNALDKKLVIALCLSDSAAADRAVSGVTYNGDPMTKAGEYNDHYYVTELCWSFWYIDNPDTGSSYYIEVTQGGKVTDMVGYAISGYNMGSIVPYGQNDYCDTGPWYPNVPQYTCTAGSVLFGGMYIDDSYVPVYLSVDNCTSIDIIDMGSNGSAGAYRILAAGGTQKLQWYWSEGGSNCSGGNTIEILLGGTQYQQSAAGAITFTGTQARSGMGKYAAGALTFTADITSKFIDKVTGLTGSITPSGIPHWLVDKATGLTGGFTPSGILATAKLFSQAVDGALTFVGDITSKSISKVSDLLGSLTFSGTPHWMVDKATGLTGSLTPSGVPHWLVDKATGLVGELTSSGALVAQGQKFLDGALTFAGNYVAQGQKALAGALTFVGESAAEFISGSEQFYQDVAGAITFVGDYAAQGQKALEGALTYAGDITSKAIAKIAGLAGELIPSGALTAYATFVKLLDGALTFVGELAAEISGEYYKELAGVLALTGDLTKNTSRVLAGAITFAGDVYKLFPKALDGAVTFAGGFLAQGQKALAGALTLAGAISAVDIAKALAGVLVSSGTVVKAVTLSTISGALTMAGNVVKTTIPAALTGALTPAGVLVAQGQKVLAGALTMAGTMSVFVSKVLSGVLSLAGFLHPRPDADVIWWLRGRTQSLALDTRAFVWTVTDRVQGLNLKSRTVEWFLNARSTLLNLKR